MKSFIALLVVATIGIAVAAPPPELYDQLNINVNDFLKNRSLVLSLVDCALEEGKCFDVTSEMKDRLKETLENNCSDCTEKQKKDVALVFKHLINKEKQSWDKLVAKFDPERKYATKYENFFLTKQ